MIPRKARAVAENCALRPGEARYAIRLDVTPRPRQLFAIVAP
jgi:hypothetical protein